MIENIQKKKIAFLQRNLLKWYLNNGRNFPWRKSKLNSYQLIISEILLQRTKAETVDKVYNNFLMQFPNWKSLDKASQKCLEEIIKPLGLYVQRSARLKNLAKEMVLRNGRLPRTKEEIAKLPFAGQYITNAILLLIKKQPAPLLDVNMARVLERYFGPRKLSDIRYDPYLQKLAWDIVKHKESKKINWAILDFGAKVCRNNRINCNNCLINKNCYHFKKIVLSEDSHIF